MYLYRDYFKAKVYSIWVHGPLGNPLSQTLYHLNPKNLKPKPAAKKTKPYNAANPYLEQMARALESRFLLMERCCLPQ